MQTPESFGFLELIGQFDPMLIAAVVLVIVAALILRIRSGAAVGPFGTWRSPAREGEFGELEPYPLEEFRKDYDPDQIWNRAPKDLDRL